MIYPGDYVAVNQAFIAEELRLHTIAQVDREYSNPGGELGFFIVFYDGSCSFYQAYRLTKVSGLYAPGDSAVVAGEHPWQGRIVTVVNRLCKDPSGVMEIEIESQRGLSITISESFLCPYK